MNAAFRAGWFRAHSGYSKCYYDDGNWSDYMRGYYAGLASRAPAAAA